MYDPFDAAITPVPDEWFGQVHIEAFVGFFQTGVGPVHYDENVHSPDQKHYLIVHFEFVPIDVTRRTFSRHLGTWDGVLEYTEVLLPSLKVLTDDIARVKGLLLGQFNFMREASGLYFRCLRVKNPDNEEGQTWKTMEFQEVYPDEAACVAAWEKHDGKEIGGSQVADVPFTPAEVKAATSEPQRATASGERMGKQRASMAAFLPTLWQQAGGDMVKMHALLKANPMIEAHFDIESPEVVELMGQ